MRLLSSLLLCLLLPATALPQTKPLLEHKGEFRFGDGQERIIAHRLIEGENRLVLAGPRVVRILDFAGAKLSDALTLDVTSLGEDGARAISPDGRRMIVFGNHDSARKEGRPTRPAVVWDLRTGKQIAALDGTSKPVRAALWSRNGRTLATSSSRYAPSSADSQSVEVTFWDGETFERKSSLPTDKVGWWRLSDDGETCLYSAGEVKGWIPIIDTKYLAPTGPLSVWDVGGAKIEQTVSARGGNVERKIRSRSFSPDGRFIALVVQPPNSKESGRRLAVFELGAGGGAGRELRPLYELKPSPKIDEWGVKFSPTGKYFWLDAGRSLQIYETRTGEKRFELQNFDEPTEWLTDEVFYTKRYGTRMDAFEAATGRHLYRRRLEYRDYSYYPDDSNSVPPAIPVTKVKDWTEIVPHPRGSIFLTHSKQYVRVCDSRTGEELQTLVSPPVDNSGKKPRVSQEPLVSKAGWSADGRSLYIISADERSVSLWRLVEN